LLSSRLLQKTSNDEAAPQKAKELKPLLEKITEARAKLSKRCVHHRAWPTVHPMRINPQHACAT
jgi:hypothetical protein